MGSDDLFFKRKQEKIASLQRRSKNRKPYDLVLIICEGRKTEPYYFKGLCEDLQLSSANIHIKQCSIGNDPLSVVKEAIELHKKYNYDQIYCVFDKDQHANYQKALDQIASLIVKDVPIHVISSVPCFEYWYLLHFEDSARPYQPKGKKSAGAQLKSELKQYIKDYNESDKDIFQKTKEFLHLALKRAKLIDASQQKNATDNPSTKVYQLVQYLIDLSGRYND